MYNQPQNCPSETCPTNNPLQPQITDWFKKYGYYKPKHNHQPIPRYQCKVCGKTFSTSTTKYTYQQKKPNINQQLFKMLVSGVSLRRCSKILEVKYDTVLARFDELAKQAEELHYEHLKKIKTSFVMVDELETYIQTQLKPLSVALAVRIKTGEVLGFSVAKMPCHGKLATLSRQLYSWTTDERQIKFEAMLKTISQSVNVDATFKSDSKTAYPNWIKNVLPKSKLHQVIVQKNVRGQPKVYDELFSINNLFAKMRNDMARLGRKTWVTTKKIEGLERHLWLYVAWNNGYKLK